MTAADPDRCEMVRVETCGFGEHLDITWTPPWDIDIHTAKARCGDPLRHVRLVAVRREPDRTVLASGALRVHAGQTVIAVVRIDGVPGSGEAIVTVSYSYRPVDA
jgi:hypothetical protein